MDYSPYLVACHHRTTPVHAYENFQWQGLVHRGKEDTLFTANCRDASSDAEHGRHDTVQERSPPSVHLPISWHRFAARDLSNVFGNIKDAFSLHFSSRPKENRCIGGKLSSCRDGNRLETKHKLRKKVCFADEMGFALTTVRIICDSLGSYMSLNNSARAAIRKPQNVAAPVSSAPVFAFNFPQLWKSRDSFRAKVEKSVVLLGNVLVKDGVIYGEVEVKNIAYEKTVFVRYTGCDWNSHSDVHASYVSRSDPKFPGYDTFAFQFPVPLKPEKNGRVIFAVCYVVNGQTFWDNNGERNYELVKVIGKAAADDELRTSWNKRYDVARDNTNTTDGIVFNVFQTTSIVWTEFTGWKWDMEHALPYW